MQENIYGSNKRLHWLKNYLNKRQKILEFGCGTGYMITLPLLRDGYDIYGLDLDPESIQYGKTLVEKYSLNPDRLICDNILNFPTNVDIIIASEVLEHIPNPDLDRILQIIKSKLKPEGILLVTVPNGYGWFEMEHWLWNKRKLKDVFYWQELILKYERVKLKIYGQDCVDVTPSSLANSPHVQRFTLKSIQETLKRNGFEIISTTGSVLFCGPASDFLFSGVTPVMTINQILGSIIPSFAAGFYIAAHLSTSHLSDNTKNGI